MIELRDVSKSYGGHAAVHPLDLAVEAGRSTALIGPSGCGKSTLLRLMLGLLWPDQGEVKIAGVRLAPDTVREVRLKTGYVVQDGGLFPHLTAQENATLVARRLGWDRGRIEARVAELADFVRLPKDSLDRYPSQLSGGQRQRVGLVRALFLDPPLLLLDEPMGALDPLVRADLRTDLRSIVRELKKTAVLVTHDLGEAAVLADEVVLLQGGRVVQRGTLTDLAERPADPFVTRFLQAQRGWS